MKAFDYLSSLILLFTAITLGELTMGLGYSLNAGTRASFYLPHTLFIIASFFGSVDYALRIYALRKVKEWQFWSLIIVLIPGLVWLLGATLCFPNIDPPAKYDFFVVFQSNKTLIYSMIVIYIISVNAAFALVYKIANKPKLIFGGVLLLLYISGIIYDIETLDYILAIVAIAANSLNGFWQVPKIKNEV